VQLSALWVSLGRSHEGLEEGSCMRMDSWEESQMTFMINQIIFVFLA
jgi:hypothetical protein